VFAIGFNRRYATRIVSIIIPGDKSPGYFRLPLSGFFLTSLCPPAPKGNL